jgi:transposase
MLVMSKPQSLPANVVQLQALVRLQEGEIERLQLIIARYRRREFGQRSEQLPHPDQLALQLEDRAIAAAAAPLLPLPKPERQPSRRQPLPAHLPRETHIHRPEHGDCPDCGGRLQQIGEDVSELLEYVPARFKVIRHVRPKLACGGCDGILQAPAPSRPIVRGMAGPGLLAHVLVSKYCDHLPLYRQTQIYAREGVELERSTLADWVGQASGLLRPLLDAIARHVLAGSKVHGDDTPVPVLAPGKGRTKTGRLWTYVRDDRPCGSTTPPAVWFSYSPDRKGEHPARHLLRFCGTLQADGYAGFNALYGSGRIQEAACWAHVRRKFYDIQQAQASTVAAEALNRIGQLYGIERALWGKPPEARRAGRRSRAAPLLTEFASWLTTTLGRVSQKSVLAEAIRYALARWAALTRYCDDGELEIDNNAAERALRTVALGRKNYLFAGADSGGERAAALYSLIGTAKLNDLDPQAYLTHVLGRIADHPVNQIDQLLPWNVAPQLSPAWHQAA